MGMRGLILCLCALCCFVQYFASAEVVELSEF
jgi:hypothetical protein